MDTNGGAIIIGDNCSINDFCIIYGGENGSVKIGNNVLIATQVVIIPENHIYDRIDIPINMQSVISKGIIIEDDVWIGAGAKILDGIKISKGSIVGAGAVVTKNVEEYSIVAGIPAKVISKRK